MKNLLNILFEVLDNTNITSMSILDLKVFYTQEVKNAITNIFALE